MGKSKRNKIKGATMVEYVLIIGLIAAGATTGLSSVSTAITTFMTTLNTTISNASSSL